MAAVAGAGTVLPPLRGALGADTSAAKAAAARPELVRFPEKTDLILLTDRPPNLETPIKYFREDLTPNEAFFVRWHLAIIPTAVDPSDVPPDRRRARRAGAGAFAGRAAQELRAVVDGRGQSVLGQLAQLFRAARARRPVGQRGGRATRSGPASA